MELLFVHLIDQICLALHAAIVSVAQSVGRRQREYESQISDREGGERNQEYGNVKLHPDLVRDHTSQNQRHHIPNRLEYTDCICSRL